MSKHSILLISWLLCSTWHVNWVRSSLVSWSYQFLEHWTKQWSVESVCTDHWRNSNGSIQSCTQSEHSYNIILLEMTLLRHILHNTQFWSLFSSLVVQSQLILVQTQTLDSGSEEMLGRVEMSKGRLKLPWQRQIFQQRKYQNCLFRQLETAKTNISRASLPLSSSGVKSDTRRKHTKQTDSDVAEYQFQNNIHTHTLEPDVIKNTEWSRIVCNGRN